MSHPAIDDGWTTGHHDDGELGTTRAGRDVTRIPAGSSVLTDLSEQLERWTDLHCTALDAEAEARVAYDDAFSDALVARMAEKVQMAVINKLTDADCKPERATLTRAEAAVKRTRAKVQEASARLTAAMAQTKYFGLNDGGPR